MGQWVERLTSPVAGPVVSILSRGRRVVRPTVFVRRKRPKAESPVHDSRRGFDIDYPPSREAHTYTCTDYARDQNGRDDRVRRTRTRVLNTNAVVYVRVFDDRRFRCR